MVLLPREETWRCTSWTCAQRVLRAWDSGMDAESVAAKYEVSRAWVHRLVQRRRKTGFDRAAETNEVSGPFAVGPAGSAPGRPDHRAARCDARRVAGGAADHGGAEHAVADDRALALHRQKKRSTPTNNAGLTSPRPGATGATGNRCATSGNTSFSMSAASPPTCYGDTAVVPAGRVSTITRPAASGRRTRWSRRCA